MPGYRSQDNIRVLGFGFETFMHSFHVSPEAMKEFDYLQDFMAAWVDQGDGLARCCGDFGIFMAAMAYAVDQYHTDPLFRDHARPGKRTGRRPHLRKLKGVFDPSRPSWIMDRTSWEKAVRNKLRYGTIYPPPVRLPSE